MKISQAYNAITRNIKLISVMSLVVLGTFSGYEHGKYVGQLGGKYDSAAYEAIISKAANVEVADSGSIQMPPTIDQMAATKEQEEMKAYRRANARR